MLGQLKKDVQADRDAIANRPVEEFAETPPQVPVRPLKMRRPSQIGYYATLTWETTKGFGLGLVQGVLNVANGVTDIGIGLINEIANNGSLMLKYGMSAPFVATYQYLRDFTGWDPLPFLPQRVTVIGEWDWSRGMVTQESDRSHWWSKMLGGQGALQLLTMGTSALWGKFTSARSASAATNATRAAAVEAEYAAVGRSAGDQLFTRRQIIEALRNARQTPTSQAVLDGIENGTFRLVVRRVLKGKDGIANPNLNGNTVGKIISLKQVGKIEQILTTLVHEGRHALDILDGLIPSANAGGPGTLFAELRAWRDAWRFASTNGYRGVTALELAPTLREAAIDIEQGYRGRIGRELTLDELRAVIQMLENWW